MYKYEVENQNIDVFCDTRYKEHVLQSVLMCYVDIKKPFGKIAQSFFDNIFRMLAASNQKQISCNDLVRHIGVNEDRHRTVKYVRGYDTRQCNQLILMSDLLKLTITVATELNRSVLPPRSDSLKIIDRMNDVNILGYSPLQAIFWLEAKILKDLLKKKSGIYKLTLLLTEESQILIVNREDNYLKLELEFLPE